MEIQSVSYKNGVVKIKYAKGGEIFTLVSEERPHPDFIKAVAGLSGTLRRFLMINPERIDRDFCKKECEYVSFMQNRVVSTGLNITVRETEDAENVFYKIQGSIAIPPTGKSIDIESLSMTYDVDWFEAETKTGTKLHTPNGSPTYLTNEDMNAIEALVNASGDFITGVRDQGTLPHESFGSPVKESSGQGGLFENDKEEVVEF